MPVYNAGDFLVEALDSILSQTYQNFELIIINDGSTDKSQKIIETYQNRYPEKIRVIYLKTKHGAFAAANRGVRISKGEYIAPMDSDDISEPERIEKEIDFLQKNPDYIVVGTHAKIIDKNGEEIGKKAFPINHQDIYQKFFEVNPIVHPSCMIRRSLMPEKTTLYRDKFGVNDDYYTLFVLLRFGKFANIPEFLFNYRIHQNNSSLQNLKQKFFNTVKIRIKAVFDLDYKPSFISVIKFLGQIAIVSLIPKTVLFNVYLLSKGIKKPKDILVNANKRFTFALSRVKSYSFSF